MSTEDVIELGSSDDEKEPAPKKIKANQATNRAHIPEQITIKPAVGLIANANKEHKARRNVIEDSKIYSGNLRNIKGKLDCKQSNILMTSTFKPIKIQNVRSIPIRAGHTKINTNVYNKAISQGPKILKNLPAGIIVKRASNTLRRNPLHILNCKKTMIKSSQVVTPTAELIDEAPSASIPQWYKRPEEEENKIQGQNVSEKTVQSMEEQNNKEPDLKNYVEITIEDSPVKPIQSQNNISTVIIEDSPIKAGLKVDNNTKQQDKQSKKKLDYPHGAETCDKVMIEIEVDLIGDSKMQSDHTSNECPTDSSTRKIGVCNSNEDNDIPVKANGAEEKTSELTAVEQEFHPVYQKLIDTCFRIENSDDMKKIVEKKIKAYYRQCSKEYVHSEEFIDFVSGKIVAIDASPDKMYLYIKDVVDELNMQRKLAKATVAEQGESKKVIEELNINQNEYDSKQQRHIRKLEKTLKKLHRAIQKLEEQEVDFDDEDDSVYLLTERYKERLVKVHAKFCQLTNSKMPSEPSIKLETPPGRHSGPTKKLEKFINKKVPIGAPLPFPDFHDVLRCVKDANEENKLRLSEMEMIEEARELFIRCGKKLQRRRQENEWRIAASRLPVNEDPADKDNSLKEVLEKNKQVASKRESEVFNKFADRQIQLKLEAEEIGDKEAEESPIESEEEESPIETDQTNLLKSKEKRKNRLRRLLQEKSKLDVEKSKDLAVELENDNLIEKTNEIVENPDTKEENGNELVTIIDDDKSKMESDFDELHLLQKLYSESEVDSSESPISLSDSESNDTEQRGEGSDVRAYDVISIENSSYSESENNDICLSNQNVNCNLKLDIDYKEISSPADSNIQKANVDEADENRLLESSDDDNNSMNASKPNVSNLEEDNISTSKISICSIESNECVETNLEAGPLKDTENGIHMYIDNENSQDNLQNNEKDHEMSVNGITSDQPIGLTNDSQ